MKKWFYPFSLIMLFIILTAAVIPSGYVYGSNTDWLSQHVTLAETIRDACLEQHTLLPSWIGLGGGSNGFQFAYYGFLRPDILIGCLLPQISMLNIIIAYMLTVYLGAVLLTFFWLKAEGISDLLAWMGSILFMTAGCLFHMHRQIMFVNYLPFLLLAFLCVRKKRYKWLPLCLLLICLSSFYFAISAFAAVGWYWYRTEGKKFWRGSFLKRYIPSAVLAAAMASALLLPTALVFLEHSRLGTDSGLLRLLELFAPNPVLNNILFNEYGMGLTLICLYAILAGLKVRRLRQDSILFLLFGLFGIFSYILNGTLYTRPKILIPFMPLVILHCVRFAEIHKTRARTDQRAWPLWPFAVMLPVSLLWFSQVQFPWIMLELAVLFILCQSARLRAGHIRPKYRTAPASGRFAVSAVSGSLAAVLLLIAPVGMYLATAGTEDWVKKSEISPGFTADELKQTDFNPLYHFDSLLSPLVSGNELNTPLPHSTMYSSVTNGEYSKLYYDTLMTPIRINNRVALLSSDNPFMLHLLGVRYLETASDSIPAGYRPILRSGENVIAENPDVLPAAYFTDDVVSQEWFDTLDPLEKLDIITRKTIVRDGSPKKAQVKSMSSYSPELTMGDLPDGLKISRLDSGWEIAAEKDCTLTLDIQNPQPGDIVLCQFEVENLTPRAVVIDINNIRNKLSGIFAPYPNGNDQFHYQFSTDSADGVNRLTITLSAGHYRLKDVQWNLYARSLLAEKRYTPLTASGTVTAKNDGYLATSVPLQNGLEILVDGKVSRTVEINGAFAGTYLKKGEHTIEFRFSPPGKTAGRIISAASAAVYIAYLLYTFLHRLLRRTKAPADTRTHTGTLKSDRYDTGRDHL